MNMNKIVITIIGILVIAGGVYAYANNQKEAAIAEQKMMEEEKMIMEKKAIEEKEMMEKEAVMGNKDSLMEKEDETMIPKEETGMMDKEESMMKVGFYEAYSIDKLARAETGDVVLFFHASWCPSCRGLDASIEGNLKSIPEGVSILKLDYDTETELKKRYGVTYQHTLVQVDKDGNQIKKWSGSNSLDALVTEIQ